jgi:hypothetical protein
MMNFYFSRGILRGGEFFPKAAAAFGKNSPPPII